MQFHFGAYSLRCFLWDNWSRMIGCSFAVVRIALMQFHFGAYCLRCFLWHS